MKFFVPVGVFAALCGIFYLGLYRDPTLVASPFIGRPAPAFDLPALFDPNERVTTDALLGQVSIVNVWASWCPGCAQEHEFLVQLAVEGSVPIIGLNWKDEAQPARKWLQTRGNPYSLIAVDRDNVTGIDWGVYGAPETFLVDQQGIIRYKHIGPLNADIWTREFVPRIEAARTGSQGG